MLLSEKFEDRGCERRGLLALRYVAGGRDRPGARVRQETGISLEIGLRYETVALAADEQRRSSDTVQPSLELRIVHPGLPGEQRQRLTVTEHDGQLGVRHFRAIDLHAGGIVI